MHEQAQQARRGRGRLLPVIVGLVLASSVVAGCGSSDNKSSAASTGPAPASTSATAAPKGTPVKFGVVYTDGSTVQNSTEVLAGDRAAVKALNANGGLIGRPVQLVECNDKGDPNQTTACGRKMVSEKVAAVMGGILINGGVLTPILKAAGIPQVGITPYTPVEFNSPNVFLFNGGGFFWYQAMAAYAGANKLPTSIVSANNPAAAGFRAALNGAIKPTGSAFTTTVLVSDNQADFTPVVASAAQKGTKSILSLVSSQMTVPMIKAAEASGSGFKWYFGPGGNYTKADAPEFGGLAGLDKLILPDGFPPFNSSNAMVTKYRTELKALEDSGDKLAAPKKQTSAGFGSWLSFEALAAMGKAGTLDKTALTAPGITKALRTTRGLDLGGVIPPWTPETKGPPGFARAANTTTYLTGYKNGTPYLITPQPLTLADYVAGKAKLPGS